MKNSDKYHEPDSMADEGDVHEVLSAARMPKPRPELRDAILAKAKLDEGQPEGAAFDYELPTELREIEEELAMFQTRPLSQGVREQVTRLANKSTKRSEVSSGPLLRVLCWSSASGLAASLVFLAVVLLMDRASIATSGQTFMASNLNTHKQVNAPQEISTLIHRNQQFRLAARRLDAASTFIQRINQQHNIPQ